MIPEKKVGVPDIAMATIRSDGLPADDESAEERPTILQKLQLTSYKDHGSAKPATSSDGCCIDDRQRSSDLCRFHLV